MHKILKIHLVLFQIQVTRTQLTQIPLRTSKTTVLPQIIVVRINNKSSKVKVMVQFMKANSIPKALNMVKES